MKKLMKVFMNQEKGKLGFWRSGKKVEILTGYLSEEMHRKLRELNKKRTHLQ